MKHAQVFLFVTLVVLMLSSVGSTDNTIAISDAPFEDAISEFAFSYTEFSQISIDNDTHFATLASDNGWAGDGDSIHPYIIENYNITIDFDSCIEINDVDSYFIIRNCLFSCTTASGMGIYLTNVNHSRIEDSIFHALNYGIYAEYTPNMIIENCTAYNNYRGIYYAYSPEVEITGCEIYENSDLGIIVTEACNFSEVHDNFIYGNGNSGFYAAFTYNSTLQNNTIYDNYYKTAGCGVALHAVDFWEIADNSIYENTEDGIEIGYSDYVYIHDNVIRNNTVHGVLLLSSRNITMTDNDIYQNRGESTIFNCGIELDSCADCQIKRNDIYNNTADGVYLYYSDFITVSENHVYNNTRHGIYLQNSKNCTIDHNDVHGNRGKVIIHIWNCGINVYRSNYTEIVSNDVYNNTQDGVFISQSYFCLAEDNRIYENARYGLYGDNSHNITASANSIYANHGDGVMISNSENWTISWNVVYNNSEFGIYLMNDDDCILYYNDIGWNSLGNAIDTALNSNYWSYSSIGNWWSDYNGTGNYMILGGSGVDYHPTVSMNMTPAGPRGYEFASTGHLMPWWTSALNPWKYVALRNGIEFATGEWPGTMFNVPIDGLPVGVNNVTLVLYHVSGHTISNQSIVEVQDTVGPTWDTTPMSRFAELGQPFSYQVSAIDASGISDYAIVGNDTFTINSTGMISNATSLDYLGEYMFEVRAYDPYDNLLTKTVTITVRDTTIPSIERVPSDIEFNEGDTGVTIAWSASDLQLAGYEVYIDGDIVHDGTIDSKATEISVSLDDLSAGSHNVTILFYDSSGNIATHTVWVTVNASTMTTPTTTDTNTIPSTGPFDQMIVLAVGVGGVIVAIVLVAAYSKKKKSG